MSAGKIATAPASFGLGIASDVPVETASPATLLAAMAAAGYTGTELPPSGTLGTPSQLAQTLAEVGLQAVGAYVPLALAGDESSFEGSLRGLRRTLEELNAVGSGTRVVLADAGGPELQRRLATGADEPRLDAAGWSLLLERVDRAVGIAAEHNTVASVHHHLATYIETAEEIDRLLRSVPAVNLTLDTAHLALAGGDIPATIRRHADRIDHVHLKDGDPAMLATVQRERRGGFLAWWPSLFTPLGRGALDLEGAIEALLEVGYCGWYVVEQDRSPFPETELARVVDEEAASRQWLRDVMSGAQPRRSAG